MARKKLSMDGNTAAAHASYAFTEVAAIYPITPSSVMAELTDSWSATGLKNIMGEKVKVMEMQSEAGAIGVIGPKRMDYKKVIANLEYFASGLTDGLNGKDEGGNSK